MIPLRFYATMLLVAMGSGGYAQSETVDFSTLNFKNAQVINQPVQGNDLTVSFKKATTPATYYTAESAIRIYGEGSFTVSSATRMITRLILTFSEKTYAPNSGTPKYASTGTLKIGSRVQTWTSQTADGTPSVTFTRPSPSGHWRLQKVEATFGEAVSLPESNADEVVSKVSPAKYSTLYYSDKALIVPANVTARTYKLTGRKLSVSRIYTEGDVIAAGTAVVLNAEAGEYRFEVDTNPTSPVGDPDNILQGTDTEKQLDADAGCYFYQLSLNAANEPGTIGFYWGTADGSAFVNGAHRAFIKIPRENASAAKPFYLFHDATTGMADSTPSTLPCKEPVPFNLSGQRVGSTYKGIVIQNGKKIAVK